MVTTRTCFLALRRARKMRNWIDMYMPERFVEHCVSETRSQCSCLLSMLYEDKLTCLSVLYHHHFYVTCTLAQSPRSLCC